VSTGKSERALGNRWAKQLRDAGWWVQKLPSSALSGLPDWLAVSKHYGITLVEAKKLQPKGAAFVPSQLTRAQRFFLEVVSKYGGRAFMVILGPDAWMMVEVDSTCGVERISRREFDHMSEPYEPYLED
jgi:hypothetical protein